MKDRTFWLIILTSFTIEEIEDLAQYAEVVEKSLRW